MAELGRRLQGCLDFKQMQRLLPLLEAKEGRLDARLDFGIDEQGQAWLQGEIRTEVVLQCQRCLEKMQYPIVAEFRLALLRHESEAENIPDEYEPLIVTTVPVRTVDILEDELILSLPVIAKHQHDCLAELNSKDETGQETSVDTQNPFAVLAELKKEH